MTDKRLRMDVSCKARDGSLHGSTALLQLRPHDLLAVIASFLEVRSHLRLASCCGYLRGVCSTSLSWCTELSTSGLAGTLTDTALSTSLRTMRPVRLSMRESAWPQWVTARALTSWLVAGAAQRLKVVDLRCFGPMGRLETTPELSATIASLCPNLRVLLAPSATTTHGRSDGWDITLIELIKSRAPVESLDVSHRSCVPPVWNTLSTDSTCVTAQARTTPLQSSHTYHDDAVAAADGNDSECDESERKEPFQMSERGLRSLCSRLRKLSIMGVCVELATFRALCRSLSSSTLVHLAFGACGMSVDCLLEIRPLSALRSLEMAQLDAKLSSLHIHHLARCLPHVSFLRFTNCDAGLDGHTLRAVADSTWQRTLTALDIDASGCTQDDLCLDALAHPQWSCQCSNDDFRYTLRKLVALEALRICGTRPQVTCEFIDEAIVRAVPLRSLALVRNDGLTVYALYYVAHLPGLEQMALVTSGGRKKHLGPQVRNILSTGRLRWFALRAAKSEFGDADVATLPTNANLQTLDLSGCRGITDLSLIVLRFPNLSALHLARTDVTAQRIEQYLMPEDKVCAKRSQQHNAPRVALPRLTRLSMGSALPEMAQHTLPVANRLRSRRPVPVRVSVVNWQHSLAMFVPVYRLSAFTAGKVRVGDIERRHLERCRALVET